MESLIDSKVEESKEYSLIQIMNYLATELGLQLTSEQAWRVREYVCMMQHRSQLITTSCYRDYAV